MRPTEILKEEHRVIEGVLDCLEKLASDASREGRLDAASAREALDFFKGFADAFHHAKEEDIFFPALEAKGFSPDQGPTAVMRSEHTTGRHFIKAMEGVLDAAGEGNATAVSAFVSQARGYIEMLREHIEKEDHCLFGMADVALTAEENAKLVEAFEKVCETPEGEDPAGRFLRIASDLKEKLGVEATTQRTPRGGCSR